MMINNITQQFDDYIASRIKQIEQLNHKKVNFQQIINIESDKTIQQLQTIKQALLEFDTTINKHIQDNPENTTFYEMHRQNVLMLLINSDRQYNANNLHISSITHTKVQTPYIRRTKDYWLATWHCIRMGAMVGGIILGAIAGLVASVFSLCAFAVGIAGTHAGGIDANGVVIISCVVGVLSAAVGAFVGAIIGGLVGLITGPLYSMWSSTPSGSIGEKIQTQGLFDYRLIINVYRQLDKENIKATMPLLPSPCDSTPTTPIVTQTFFARSPKAQTERGKSDETDYALQVN